MSRQSKQALMVDAYANGLSNLGSTVNLIQMTGRISRRAKSTNSRKKT